MENAMRSNENKMEHAVDKHGNKLVSALGSSEELLHFASDFATKFKGTSEDVVKESIGFVKRYPIHTAIGAVAIGFFAGILVKRS